MKHVLVLLGVLAGSLCQAQDVFGEGKKTFLLMPAEAISSGVVSNVEISASGRHVIFQKTAIPTIEELTGKPGTSSTLWYLYDRITKTTTKLAVPEKAKRVSVVGDGSVVFYCGYEVDDPQGFINVRTGATTRTNINIQELTYFGDKPFAPFLVTTSENGLVNLIAPGRQPVSVKLPPKVGMYSPTSADGTNIYFNAFVRTTPMRFGRVAYSLSTGTANFSEMTRDEFMKLNEQEQPQSKFWFENVGDLAYVKLTEEKVTSSPQASKAPLEVTSAKQVSPGAASFIPKKAKLALATCKPVFSDTSEFVVYQDAGALLIREIKPIDPDLAKKVVEAELKTKAMNDAKQAALALLLYGADMDDILPGAEGWEDKVMPYCLDKEMLKKFNYTFRGGDLNNVESPSTTEMGFVLGPGGRAVAYVDGHVKWIPNP